jgi:hypothetical protein
LTLSESIGKKHKVLLATSMVLVFDYEGHEVSLFSKGRMLIKNVNDEAQAFDVSRAVISMLSGG